MSVPPVPGEIGDDRAVLDEFAAHGRGLPLEEDFGGCAVAEVVFPGCAGDGVEIIVNPVGAQRD